MVEAIAEDLVERAFAEVYENVGGDLGGNDERAVASANNVA